MERERQPSWRLPKDDEQDPPTWAEFWAMRQGHTPWQGITAADVREQTGCLVLRTPQGDFLAAANSIHDLQAIPEHCGARPLCVEVAYAWEVDLREFATVLQVPFLDGPGLGWILVLSED
jgi:hypothetical protein